MPGPSRIGVFGGTFDPPHIGHLVAAVNVAFALELDTVFMVVAAVPWQKVGRRTISDSADRLEMVRLAVGGRPELEVSTIEIDRGGDSVTADTVAELVEANPNCMPVVIVGSDAAAGIPTWRRVDELAAMATFAVIDRPGASGGRPPVGFTTEVVPCPLMDVSSSDIRDRSRKGLPIDFLVPDAVRDYIEDRELYR